MTKNRCSPVSLVLSIAVGIFLVCAGTAQADGVSDGCVGNILGKKANCTANDVRLTAVVGEPHITEPCQPQFCTNDATKPCVRNSDCPGSTCNFDTMTFDAIGQFTAGPQRYDVGVYIATDGDPNGDGARTGSCTRFAFEENAVDLDSDQCGDILANSTQDVHFGPVTVACVDNDNNGSVDIINCETWGNGADEVPSQNSDCGESPSSPNFDVRAGTPSKCGCGILPVCIAIADANACDTEECHFRCSATATVDCDPAAPNCAAGETCEARAIHVPVDDGTSCGAAGDQCNDPSQCLSGVCVVGGPKPDGTDCEALPTDAVPPAVCDAQDKCLDGACVEKVKDAGSLCRAAGNECDAAELCDGSSPLCPADICDTTGTRPAVHFCGT